MRPIRASSPARGRSRTDGCAPSRARRLLRLGAPRIPICFVRPAAPGSGRRLLRALGHASPDALPRVLVASCGSARPASQSASFVRRPRAPGVVSCARSVTHQRMRAFTCSSPPSARLAPHPDLRRPIGGSGLWLIAALAGTAFAAHHATPLLFLPPALLAGLSTVLLGVDGSMRAARLRRAVMTVAAVALAGTVAIVPFWLWADGGIHQAFIPHNSRANFLVDFGAQAVYLWGVYGVLPALALFGLRLRPDRRTAAVAILAGCLAILGLGGTTPIPP